MGLTSMGKLLLKAADDVPEIGKFTPPPKSLSIGSARTPHPEYNWRPSSYGNRYPTKSSKAAVKEQVEREGLGQYGITPDDLSKINYRRNIMSKEYPFDVTTPLRTGVDKGAWTRPAATFTMEGTDAPWQALYRSPFHYRLEHFRHPGTPPNVVKDYMAKQGVKRDPSFFSARSAPIERLQDEFPIYNRLGPELDSYSQLNNRTRDLILDNVPHDKVMLTPKANISLGHGSADVYKDYIRKGRPDLWEPVAPRGLPPVPQNVPPRWNVSGQPPPPAPKPRWMDY